MPGIISKLQVVQLSSIQQLVDVLNSTWVDIDNITQKYLHARKMLVSQRDKYSNTKNVIQPMELISKY